MFVHILAVLAPIFGLILTGFLCRRFQLIGPTAASELNRFVVWLCLPALIFESTATARLEDIWHPGFIWVTIIATLGVFAATVIWKLCSGRGLASASIDGLGAGYANTGYVGIPLCLLVLGDEGLEPALIASLIVVCLLFALAVVLIEVGLQTEKRLSPAIRKVALALAKNPLVVTPIIGGLWNVLDIGLNQPAITFLDMLGGATTPCALVSLGAFLAAKHTGSANGAYGLVALKLVVHPLITWVLAYHVFHLPEFWAKAAVLLAALPTGTGPYMLAELYQREPAVVSRTILFSTVGSLVSLSVLLAWL